MALILAVEPDKKQALKIAALAKNSLGAELLLAESSEPALQILATRVPDLILTSLLLSPKDESALTERLRELDSAGTHVQTLGIPVLGNSKRRASDRLGAAALFQPLRRREARSHNPAGCGPAGLAAPKFQEPQPAAAEPQARH